MLKQSKPTYFYRVALIIYALVFQPLIFASQANASNTSHAGDPTEKVKGSLVIIGGALRADNTVVWETIVKQAGGKGSRIAIIPAASGNPQRAAEFAASALNSHGAFSFIVPLSTRYADTDSAKTPDQIQKNPYWVAQIQQAQAVYFTGGDQAKITKALLDTNGNPSPMLEAIWSIYRQGGVIAGTSAGAAIMSTTMFSNAKSVLNTLKQGVTEGNEIASGLGFIGNQVFIDQHLIIRGRFARMLPAMLKKSYVLGLGIDENTALLVKQQNTVEVVGYKGAILWDLSSAKTDSSQAEFNLQDARISYLSHGDQFNIATKKISPANDKQLITTPQSEEADQAPAFHPNILANTAIVEAMSQLMESKQSHAKGLAFGDPRGDKGQLGYEFVLTKKEDSRAYFSSSSGAEALTLINLSLDIQPVQMAKQLYQALGIQKNTDKTDKN
nr:cyanophycinase [uncultured Undibacterium sp.]